MPRVKCKTVYSYTELSDSAKETARNEIQEFTTQDDWWEQVYEDADTIASLMGIEIDRKKANQGTGPAIWFSGFASQGDGACFEGRYAYKPGSVKATKEHAPEDEELHRIVTDLAAVQRQARYRLKATIIHRGAHYYHPHTTDIDVFEGDGIAPAHEGYVESIQEYLRDFMRWIYKQLEQEYDYHATEEYCSEVAEANDWEFNEDGTMED